MNITPETSMSDRSLMQTIKHFKKLNVFISPFNVMVT
jgi:hypothetical protein